MRKIIYMGAIGFLFVMGFLNLEGNDWKPVELPKFATNFFESSGQQTIPVEMWKRNLIGSWKYNGIKQEESYSIHYDGRVTFDSIYKGEWRLSVKYVDSKDGDEYVRGGGTLLTSLIFENDSTWLSQQDDCNFKLVLNNSTNENLNLCLGLLFQNFGYTEDDYYDYEVDILNNDRMEFSRVSLATNKRDIYKFARSD